MQKPSNPHDKVVHSQMNADERRKALRFSRFRIFAFLVLAVLFALISIYDNLMVKLLMMFLLILTFWYFLKSHLRLKYDLGDGMKCVQEFDWPEFTRSLDLGIVGFHILESAYGPVHLRKRSKEGTPKKGECIVVEYLPLSNVVLHWAKQSD